MSIIHDIAELMLREGDIKAQEQREIVAADEERRQNKWYNRPLRTTLKALATVAPLFIPGMGPFGSLLGAGAGEAFREPEFLDPSQNPDVLVRRRGY